MEVCQQCHDCLHTSSDTGTYITQVRRNHKDTIVAVSYEQLPDDGFVIEHDSILLPFIYAVHCNPIVYPSDDDSSDTKTNSENECIVPA